MIFSESNVIRSNSKRCELQRTCFHAACVNPVRAHQPCALDGVGSLVAQDVLQHARLLFHTSRASSAASSSSR